VNILFLSRWFPYPPDNGSKIRIYYLLKSLAIAHRVVLLSFAEEEITTEQHQAMGQYCARIFTVPYKPFRPGTLDSILGLLSPKPRSVISTFNPQMQNAVNELVKSGEIELIIASQTDMAGYAANVGTIPKIFEELELTMAYEKLRDTTGLSYARRYLTWLKHKHYVKHLMPQFDACTVVSKPERMLALDVCPNIYNLSVIPNGVDTNHNELGLRPPEPHTLVYSGALSYIANFDAVNFFLAEIFPLIQQQVPNVKFFITGKSDSATKAKLPKRENVYFTGFLPDIRPRIAGSWASVVPLRTGGGTRLKILEALALGTPVVATQKGAEGLEVEPEQDILIADTPAEFAKAVIRLLDDADLRRKLSLHGRQTVEQKYDWDKIGQRLNDLIETIGH
jgi:glycosyltransferase involved in cell wall biosynthesis